MRLAISFFFTPLRAAYSSSTLYPSTCLVLPLRFKYIHCHDRAGELIKDLHLKLGRQLCDFLYHDFFFFTQCFSPPLDLQYCLLFPLSTQIYHTIFPLSTCVRKIIASFVDYENISCYHVNERRLTF
nr:MAG TPA: hypothetical protein [Caudoviricetes sp.]